MVLELVLLNVFVCLMFYWYVESTLYANFGDFNARTKKIILINKI